ncbi:hypothetical protein SPHV1_410031 [Novosphingobium sp. KN65.2]|nr:hypothetical protein SPHV1_410031 [Novosphingobium sp. KN65.2]
MPIGGLSFAMKQENEVVGHDLLVSSPNNSMLPTEGQQYVAHGRLGQPLPARLEARAFVPSPRLLP